jgi:hypothetical protein
MQVFPSTREKAVSSVDKVTSFRFPMAVKFLRQIAAKYWVLQSVLRRIEESGLSSIFVTLSLLFPLFDFFLQA